MNELIELPSAIHAERTILGALLLDSSRLLEVGAQVSPEDFYLDSHQRILKAMIEMEDGVDIVTLCQFLQNRKQLDIVGGWAYISDLTSDIPARPEIDSYLRIVREKAISRRLLALAGALEAKTMNQSIPTSEIAEWTVAEVSRIITEGQKEKDVFTAEELSVEAEYRLCDRPESSNVIPTGLKDLDEWTDGGIRPGELWIVGAAPSRGKTTLARQIVKNCITRGVASYVHSGEMTKESWHDVTACLIAGMETHKIREPRLMNLADRENLRKGLRALGKLPFYLSDTGGIHLDRLIWNATKQVRDNKIKLFVIDYAQIIAANGKDERQKVSEVAQRLRLFAKDENVATILLSQSPRPEGRSINARPTMFSLKESGALEEAAHCVILPYRPVDTETGIFTGEDELIIGKNRWGSIGSVKVKLNGKYLRFESR